ncbi:MAG: hypothetical protein HY253_04390 [Burkholderiales bacterium]|nr:hypothetical protein [Burkholderiales bacterium]
MKDQGDWLSAQQAVMPDGSEVSGLRLVNKKLPPLVPPAASPQENELRSDDTSAVPSRPPL